MNLRRATQATVCGVIAAACLAVTTQSASARWIVHSAIDATEIITPPGATDDQICSDQVKGNAGYAFPIEDPNDHTPPPAANTPVTYQVWHAPPGTRLVDQFSHVVYVDAAGVTYPARLVKDFTTPGRTRLPSPIPADSVFFIYTSAPFSEALTGVLPGDVLGLKWLEPRTDGTALVSLMAVGCGDTGFIGEWQRYMRWCRAPGQLLLGDYNGDGREDMLCHNPDTGYKWVALAKADIPGVPFTDRFTGTDWQRDMGWCRTPRQLLVGDYNGDGRQDMLCHNPDTGYKWVALARAGGGFTGTDWQRNMGWCRTPRQLLVGDYNGDGRQDMLCHNTTSGYKWIALAKAGGGFTGTDWQRNMGWCRTPRQLLVGDYNGDGRQDMLCHNPGTGYKWIAYSDL
jgi:hypothetical protein